VLVYYFLKGRGEFLFLSLTRWRKRGKGQRLSFYSKIGEGGGKSLKWGGEKNVNSSH